MATNGQKMVRNQSQILGISLYFIFFFFFPYIQWHRLGTLEESVSSVAKIRRKRSDWYESRAVADRIYFAKSQIGHRVPAHYRSPMDPSNQDQD